MCQYHSRTIEHSLGWLKGDPTHNNVDGECVSDFSCCFPALFTKDFYMRQISHVRLIEMINNNCPHPSLDTGERREE